MSQLTSTEKKGCFGCFGIIVIFFILLCIFAPAPGKKSNFAALKSFKSFTKTTVQKQPLEKYPPGKYKAGVNLPPGEYVAITPSSKAEGQVAVGRAADSLAATPFINRAILQISEGQHIQTENCQLYPIANAPKATAENQCLPPGMYKAGTDLPSGQYTVLSDHPDSYMDISRAINTDVSRHFFQDSANVLLTDGQYITLSQARLMLSQ